MSAEQDAGGVRSNLIPREGGNTFKGVVFGNYTNSSLNSRQRVGRAEAPGLQSNSVDRLYDFNPSAGGGIW